MAGCTDESYVDKTCPQKLDFKDQEWVGLQHCNIEPSGDTDWGGCKVPPEDSTELVKLPNESCDPYCSTTLWVGTSDIPSFAVSISPKFPHHPDLALHLDPTIAGLIVAFLQSVAIKVSDGPLDGLVVD